MVWAIGLCAFPARGPVTFLSPDVGSICFTASGIFISGAMVNPACDARPSRPEEIIRAFEKNLYPFSVAYRYSAARLLQQCGKTLIWAAKFTKYRVIQRQLLAMPVEVDGNVLFASQVLIEL